MRSRRRLAFIAGFAAASSVTSLLLFHFYANELRIHVLQPVIEAWFIVRYYLEFIPQLFLWMIPLVLVIIITLRRAVRWTRPEESLASRGTHAAAPAEGELATLAQQIRRAQHNRFARVRVSRTLVEIGARLIAGREGISLRHARQRLADGYWQPARSVHHFLIPRRHYTARQTGHDFSQSLQQAVEHLEKFDRYA